jgi:apolipoprotein N-acyltransferase
MATTTHQATNASRRRTFIQAFANRDRLAYLWLVLAIVLLTFGTVRWMIPLAAWLYPVFLLRFVRTQPLLRGILLVLLSSVLVSEVTLLGFWGPIPEGLSLLMAFGFGILYALPYVIDRLVAPRLEGLLGTLVFPLAVTTVWYLHSVLDPLAGAWGNPANTQYGNLPLLQLLSVTGLWGIVLVMSWLASVVNWAWERGFAWPRVRGGAVLYASLLALVLLFGGARLALFPAQGSTVRVAGISRTHALQAMVDQQFSQQISQQTWTTLVSGTATPAERARARQAVAPVFAHAFAPVNDDLLARSEQEARAGAKIIVWPEGGAGVLQEDEAALLARASTLARTTGTYLDMGMSVLLQRPGPSGILLDQIILMNPSGSVVWRSEKIHLVGGVETGAEVPGIDRIPTVQTPYGRLSNVVCFDADFPGTLHQAGQAGADIMLIPSNDWQAIDPLHTQMATFRAIENGYSLVRQTSNGLSMAVDYEGNVLAASDYFTTDPQVMVAYVPVQGVRTIYATIGDLFAWLSLAGLVVLIGVAIARRRKAGEAGAAEPINASPTEAVLTAPRQLSREPIEAVFISPRPTSGEPPEALPT